MLLAATVGSICEKLLDCHKNEIRQNARTDGWATFSFLKPGPGRRMLTAWTSGLIIVIMIAVAACDRRRALPCGRQAISLIGCISYMPWVLRY